MKVRSLFYAAALLSIAAACAAPQASPSPSPRPSATPPPPTSPPTATPTTPPALSPTPTGSLSGAVVVTFDVVGETYRILLTDPDDVAIANRLLAGEAAPKIPNGHILRGDTGVNTGYSWSIDPETVEFAEVTVEVCDGLPSYVEDGTLTGDQYCPWSAEVVAIDPAP